MIRSLTAGVAMGALCLVMVAGLVSAQQESASWAYLYGPDHRGNVDPLPTPLVLKWKFSSGVSGPAVSTPAAGPDRVFFAIKQYVYAVDRHTGAKLWELDLGRGNDVHSGLVLYKGMLLFGADDRNLWAVNAATGQKMWRINAGGKVKSTPLVHGGRLYFGADDGYLYAADIASHSVLWRYQTGGPIRVSPALFRNKLFFASQDGYLYALYYQVQEEKRPRVAWRAFLSSANVFCSPLIHRNQVIVGAGDRLIAYNADTGDKLWRFEAQGINALITGTPAAGNRTIFVGSRNGHIYQIRVGDGTAIWWYPDTESGGEVLSSPTVAGGSLLLCRMGKRRVVGFQLGPEQPGLGTNKLVWNYNLPAPPTTTTTGPGAGPGGAPGAPGMPGMPGMGGAMMGPGGAAGARAGGAGVPGQPGMPGQPGVGGVGTTTGLLQYHFKYEEAVRSSLIAAGGNVYLVGDDGALYAFGDAAADNIGPRITAPQMTVATGTSTGTRTPTAMRPGAAAAGGQLGAMPGPGMPGMGTMPGAPGAPGANLAAGGRTATGGTQQTQQMITYALWSEPADAFLPPPARDDLIQIPGTPPLYISFEIVDEGCGVNPDSIKVFLDGQPVSEDQMQFVADEGVVWYKLEQTPGAAEVLLNDGLHILVVQATDWCGNTGAARLFFVVDNTLAAPKLPGQQATGAGGGMGGPGGWMRPAGGMMRGGANPPAPPRF